VRIANDTIYGLNNGVASANPERALAIAARLRSGQVGPGRRLPHAVAVIDRGSLLPHWHSDRAHPCPHLNREWAHPCPHLVRDSAQPCPHLSPSHIWLETRLAPAHICPLPTSTPGLGLCLPYLHRDRAHPYLPLSAPAGSFAHAHCSATVIAPPTSSARDCSRLTGPSEHDARQPARALRRVRP
jgi:hypothetical protein